jgi:tetratricopeptide (TPR) repeat protein
MLTPTRTILFLAIVLAAMISAPPGLTNQTRTDSTQGAPDARREEAYRANNLGVALLEQFKYGEGAEQFRRALKIDPELAIARINLCIALYNEPNLTAALQEAKAAAAASPSALQPHYMLGLIAKLQNRVDDAIAEFQHVVKADPRDVGANVNLSQIYLQQRKYAEGLPAARAAYAAEPYNVTAAYTLATALLRSGQREEGSQMMQHFQALRQSGYATKIDKDYLDQGRYSEAIASTGAEPDLVDPKTPDVSFEDSTSSSLPDGGKPKSVPTSMIPAFNRRFTTAEFSQTGKNEILAALNGGAVLFDYDGDGDLDLFTAGSEGQKLYRNDGGKFVDVTAQSGALSSGSGVVTAVVAGDYDNDEKADLFVVRYGGSSLYHNDGGGKFSDVTAASEIPAYPYLSISIAFVDVDHDGDLDIFIAGFADLSKLPGGDASKALSFPTDFAGAPNRLLRNNGNGKFTDITSDAKVGGALGHAVAVVPTDFDNRRDIDLLVANFDSAPNLFRNLRDGTFVDVAAESGLSVKGQTTCATAVDLNKDGYTDFYFGVVGGPGTLALSDGKGRFSIQPAPAVGVDAALQEGTAQFIDYDNDGLLDLVRITAGSPSAGLTVSRNIGNKWDDVTAKAAQRSGSGPSAQFLPRTLASGDIDGDGDIDIVARDATGNLRILRNEGGSKNRSLRVRLAGKASNRSGVGSKVEVRAGSLRQKLETYSASPAPGPADIVFGIGKREGVDAVRVLWPSGIVQAETEIPKAAPGTLAQSLVITELDRKPSSCPFLYAWNGEKFEFITDFMGGGEMGYWEAPGQRNKPDPDEYVRITGDQLRERNGRYEIRVTNELEEALYVDRLQLIAVAHPSDTEVYPNEGMVDPPRKFILYRTRGARPPLTAVDDHGHDVLEQISRLDRRYPDDFKLSHIRGYAEEHTLTLDLGKPSTTRTLLLMTAWTDYAFSSDNVAAHQAGLTMKAPSIQVKDENGRWKTVIDDIGIPVGRPQTVTVDMTGKFLSGSGEVRIVTNMRIYWDRILVDTSSGTSPAQMTRIDPQAARLHWRGFSAEVTPDGREPFGYDYSRVSATSPWKTMPGRYTREGDVKSLLLRSDDMFVISMPGDEIAVSFDATRLPPLPQGFQRTFLLYADGFSKEMDINSASPDQVRPLPFHGMRGYPYSGQARYPLTPGRRDYLLRYNTRVVRFELPALDIVCAGASGSVKQPRTGR